MEIFRFMSKKEFDKLINGEELINKTKHQGNTNSVGFCFMEDDPEYCYEFLSGVVSEDVCVIFETDEELNQTYGIYADPCGSFFDTIVKDEYCINKYDKEKFKIKKMAIPEFWSDGGWVWYENIDEFCQKLDEKIKKN